MNLKTLKSTRLLLASLQSNLCSVQLNVDHEFMSRFLKLVSSCLCKKTSYFVLQEGKNSWILTQKSPLLKHSFNSLYLYDAPVCIYGGSNTFRVTHMQKTWQRKSGRWESEVAMNNEGPINKCLAFGPAAGKSSHGS